MLNLEKVVLALYRWMNAANVLSKCLLEQFHRPCFYNKVILELHKKNPMVMVSDVRIGREQNQSLWKANCGCGYSFSAGVDQTTIMANDPIPILTDTFSFPFLCRTCRTVFDGDAWSQQSVCPECGKDGCSYADTALKSTLKVESSYDLFTPQEVSAVALRAAQSHENPKNPELMQGMYFCPQCESYRLEFVINVLRTRSG